MTNTLTEVESKPLTNTFPWSEEYPFLTFTFNAAKIPPSTWALLGECSSKIEHVSGTPLRKDVADEFNMIFLAKGVHATTAIEGNTLSEDQVKQRLERGLTLPPTQEYLGREVDNIVRAYNHLIKQLKDGVPFHLTPQDFKNLNRLVLEGLEVEEGVVPGEYRTGRVAVSDYRAPAREHLEQMVQLGCEMLNREDWTKRFAGPFIIPILRAILSHLYIAWMHPFGDGNGRTARLVEFDLMIRAGVPIASAHLLSDHYNRTRAAYYKALSMARKDSMYFLCYAVEGLRDLLGEQIALIRAQQMDVTWENYIYAVFRKDEGVTSNRLREVALALGANKVAVPADKIPSLTPKLAPLYHYLTSRTLYRDLRTLRQQKIILMDASGVRPNLELVRAFLPTTGAARSIEDAKADAPAKAG